MPECLGNGKGIGRGPRHRERLGQDLDRRPKISLTVGHHTQVTDGKGRLMLLSPSSVERQRLTKVWLRSLILASILLDHAKHQERVRHKPRPVETPRLSQRLLEERHGSFVVALVVG